MYDYKEEKLMCENETDFFKDNFINQDLNWKRLIFSMRNIVIN